MDTVIIQNEEALKRHEKRRSRIRITRADGSVVFNGSEQAFEIFAASHSLPPAATVTVRKWYQKTTAGEDRAQASRSSGIRPACGEVETR
jgi:hypothetical protein